MGTFRLSVSVRRSPADVFAFLAEMQNMPLWYDAIQHVTKTTPGPTAAGSRYQIVRSLPGGPAYNDVEVTEYDLNSEVALESREGSTPFRYRYRVEPDPEGTMLTLDGSISGDGLPGPVAHLDRLATRLFKHGMNQSLHERKRIVEASHRDET
jgi:uncharacterized protein YndB with AHSA1/START domain